MRQKSNILGIFRIFAANMKKPPIPCKKQSIGG